MQADLDARKLSAAEAAAQNGDLMMTQIRYADAARYYAEAVGLTPETHADQLSERLRAWAEAAWRAGDFPAGLAAARACSDLDEARLPADDALLAIDLNNLAELYRGHRPLRRGRAALPARHRHRREDARPRAPRPRHRLNNLAELYRATGRYAEAEPLYQRAIAIGEKALGPEHPDLATWLNNLAVLYQATGRYAEAEPLFQRAIAIGEKTLGPEHPDLATGLNNLAELYQATGRYAEAEPLYQRAIAISEKTLGPEHPDLAIRLNNLAAALPGHRPLRRGRAALPARPRHRREGPRPRAPRPSPLGLNNLAELYRATGRYAEAEPLFQRALAIGEKTLGPEHPNLAIRLNNLAMLYQATGRYAEAEPLYQRALAIGEKTLGPEHPDLATWLNNLAVLYQDTGRYAEAEPLYQRAIAIGEKALGPEHPDLAIGSTTWPSSTRPPAATPRPSRSTSAPSRSWPAARPSVPGAGPRELRLLLDQLGRGDEAAALRAEAAAIREQRTQTQAPSR